MNKKQTDEDKELWVGWSGHKATYTAQGPPLLQFPSSLSLLNSKTIGNQRTLCDNMYKKQRKNVIIKKMGL